MNISNNVIIAIGSVLAFIIFMNILMMIFFRRMNTSGYKQEKKRDSILSTNY